MHATGRSAQVVALVIAVAVAARDLADEQDHRRRILPRDMHPGGGVAGPRAAGDERHAGAAGVERIDRELHGRRG